ncbi:glycosyl transferase family 2 [Clostridium scatologenes]|uniref:Glycosyl transferase family 2 n=2 Tax=Clostridium scatologenes TaxID=1548 RepID=A0A0E3M8D0_CLOSL|nr:glycosyl transferase family 2 [Clostridium scatologenes]
MKEFISMMGEFVYNFVICGINVFQVSVIILTMYYLIISLFGFYKKEDKEAENCKPEKKFALLVAAHDEEMVIGKIVDSLKELDYPKDLYDIFVIADNCTDKTAEIARKHGGNVYERNVSDKRGKGYALEWMFARVFKMDTKYDAIAIFDADNLVSKNFLNEMNYKLLKGYKVVQGYIDSKNPDDSWITQSYSISFWTANRLFQLGRSNLGLSSQIGGTGFCMDTETLKKLGWGSTCLTEDLEFTCKLVLNGHKVGWAHNAIVYDEKPLTLKQSWNQRKRWMQGFADVFSRFFVRLMKKAVKERSFITLDCALYTMQPYFTLFMAASALISLIKGFSGIDVITLDGIFRDIFYSSQSSYSQYAWMIFSIGQFLFTPIVMLLETKLSKKMFGVFALYSLNAVVFSEIFRYLRDDGKYKEFLITHHLAIENVNKGYIIPSIEYTVLITIIYIMVFVIIIGMIDRRYSLKIFIWYMLFSIYTLTWIPITVQGILNKDKKEWSHTKHIRQISIQEVE